MDTPRLAHPRIERVLGTTRTILAFIGLPRSFVGHFIGFGANLPHVFVGQQLGACLPIQEKRSYASLHFAPMWLSSGRGAYTFASRAHRASTLATHGTGTIRGRTLFLFLFFFTGVGHGLGHCLGVVVNLGQRFEWRCAAPKVALPHLHTP